MKRSGVGSAFGEFLLIVVGVLVALGVESYVRGRSDDRLARQYEADLLEDLRTDTALVRLTESVISLKMASLAELRAQLGGSGFNAARVATAAFWGATQFQPDYQEDTYVELLNSGNLSLLDLDVRRALTRLSRRFAADRRSAELMEHPLRPLGLSLPEMNDHLVRCHNMACPEGMARWEAGFDDLSMEARRYLRAGPPMDTTPLLALRTDTALRSVFTAEMASALESRRRLDGTNALILESLALLEERALKRRNRGGG